MSNIRLAFVCFFHKCRTFLLTLDRFIWTIKVTKVARVTILCNFSHTIQVSLVQKQLPSLLGEISHKGSHNLSPCLFTLEKGLFSMSNHLCKTKLIRSFFKDGLHEKAGALFPWFNLKDRVTKQSKTISRILTGQRSLFKSTKNELFYGSIQLFHGPTRLITLLIWGETSDLIFFYLEPIILNIYKINYK